MAINYKGTNIEKILYGGNPDGDPALKAKWEEILAREPIASVPNPDWDRWKHFHDIEQQCYNDLRNAEWSYEESKGTPQEDRYYQEMLDARGRYKDAMNETNTYFPNGEPPKYIENPSHVFWQEEEREAYQKWQDTKVPPTEVQEAYKWDPNKNQYVLVFQVSKDIFLEARAYICSGYNSNTRKYEKAITLKINYIYQGQSGIAPNDISVTVSTSFNYDTYISIPGLEDSSFTINKGDTGGEKLWATITGSYYDFTEMHNTISLSNGKTFYFNLDGDRYIDENKLFYNNYKFKALSVTDPSSFKLNSGDIIMTGHAERVGTSWATKYKFTVKWATSGPHPRDAVCWLEDWNGNNFKSLYLSKNTNETLVAEGVLDKGIDYSNTGVNFCVRTWGFTYTQSNILNTIHTGVDRYWAGWWAGEDLNKTLSLAAWKGKGGDGDDYPWPAPRPLS